MYWRRTSTPGPSTSTRTTRALPAPSKDEIDDIKVKAAQRRLESIEVDLKLLHDADEPAYRELKERLQNLVRD
jgi:hypothetical protein